MAGIKLNVVTHLYVVYAITTGKAIRLKVSAESDTAAEFKAAAILKRDYGNDFDIEQVERIDAEDDW